MQYEYTTKKPTFLERIPFRSVENSAQWADRVVHPYTNILYVISVGLWLTALVIA